MFPFAARADHFLFFPSKIFKVKLNIAVFVEKRIRLGRSAERLISVCIFEADISNSGAEKRKKSGAENLMNTAITYGRVFEFAGSFWILIAFSPRTRLKEFFHTIWIYLTFSFSPTAFVCARSYHHSFQNSRNPAWASDSAWGSGSAWFWENPRTAYILFEFAPRCYVY